MTTIPEYQFVDMLPLFIVIQAITEKQPFTTGAKF